MGQTADASGWLRIADNDELAEKIKEHITYQLSGGYIADEQKHGYRTISFDAPLYPDYINYHEEDYLALYELVGTYCAGGMITFTDGVEHWCHRYDPKTGQWTEHKGRVVYEGLLGPDDQDFLKGQGRILAVLLK